MTWFKDYELATSLDEAAALLSEPGSAIIGGGSRLVALKPDDVEHLIDLMPLGLDRLREDERELRLEARLRLEELAQREDFGGLLKGAVLSLAHSVNLRNQMTVAGETAWSLHLNELQVALLVLDARVELHAREPLSIVDYLADAPRSGIITSLILPKEDGWRFGFERVAPSEGSRPLLVLAAAARVVEEELKEIRLAAGNLGPLAQRLPSLERRLRGSQMASLGKFAAEDGDNNGSTIVASPNAGAEDKWLWTISLVKRFLASLPGVDAS